MAALSFNAMQQKTTWTKYIATLALGTFLGWQGNYWIEDTKSDGLNEQAQIEQDGLSMDEFWQVWDAIQTSYVNIDSVDAQKQSYGAIEGLVEALDDPYSVFMDPTATEEFNSSLNGELEGIGAELTEENGRLTILTPLKESPAEKAGLKPGDFIYLVDDKPTSEMSLFDAIMAIRGPKDSTVKLTVLREGMDDPIEFNIVRESIQIPSVELSTIEKNGENFAHQIGRAHV